MKLFEQALLEAGLGQQVSAQPLSDGLSDCWRVETDQGPYCVKWNPQFGRAVLEGQKRSLEMIGATGSLRVPTPHLVGELENQGSFLVMEWLELEPLNNQQRLAEGLMRMHQVTHEQHGFECPTFLGALELNNSWRDSWSQFFLEQRMAPLIQLAVARVPAWARLFEKAQLHWGPLLEGCRPVLLHGDLSPANVAQTLEGEPVVFDPASYFGHSQMDLALYPALQQYFPPDVPERLRLYQLYHRLQQLVIYGAAEQERIQAELQFWTG
jgi:protein-ribulosamine 3-kinase